MLMQKRQLRKQLLQLTPNVRKKENEIQEN